MNARDNTPLRTMIANRLSAGEDTAAGIALAIGKGDTPSIVVKELNAMRTDGQVECEQRERGKKKGLVYWLAVPIEVAAGNVAPESPDDRTPAIISESVLPAGMRQGTRAAQIYRVLPLYGAKPMTARQIATATGAALGLISPTLSGMVKARQISRVSSGVGEAYGYTRLPAVGGDSKGGETDIAAAKDIPPPQYDPNKVAFVAAADRAEDFSLLGVIADIRAAVGDKAGKIMLGELAAHIGKLYELGEAHREACMQWERSMMGAIGEDGPFSVVEAISKLKAENEEMRSQLEALQREAMRGASCLSGQDRYTAAGYLVRATKRKPRTLQAEDKAREAAMSSIRAGAQRAEVYALVPIGCARRGAEWRPA